MTVVLVNSVQNKLLFLYLVKENEVMVLEDIIITSLAMQFNPSLVKMHNDQLSVSFDFSKIRDHVTVFQISCFLPHNQKHSCM